MAAVGSSNAVTLPTAATAPVDMSAIVAQLQAVVAQLTTLVQTLQAQAGTGPAAGAANVTDPSTAGGGPAATTGGCGCGGAAGAAGGPTQLADTDATGGANGAPTTLPPPGGTNSKADGHTKGDNRAKADDAKQAAATQKAGGASDTQQKIVDFAKAQLGKSYVYAAAGPDHFDCSGLTMKALEQVGVHLPHHAADQAKMGTPVDKKDLQPGDLVFFEKPVGHTGIYIGDDKIIHAPQTGDVVKISSLDDSWYKDNYSGARRFV